MTAKEYDPTQIAAVQEHHSFKSLLRLVQDEKNRRGSRSGIGENPDALRLVVNIRDRTKAAYHNIAEALGHNPETGAHWVSGGTLAMLVKWGVTSGLVAEAQKRGKLRLFMKKGPEPLKKSLITAAVEARKARRAAHTLMPQLTLPDVPLAPPPPPPQPVTESAADAHYSPKPCAVVLDPAGLPMAEITGSFLGTGFPVALWCACPDGSMAKYVVVPVR